MFVTMMTTALAGTATATAAASAISWPTILSGASLAMTGLAIAAQVQGAGQQAQAQQHAYNYQAQVARNNQVVMKQQADDARARGAIEEKQFRQQVARQVGTQRASAAANGVLVDDGSALGITEETERYGDFDARTIRNNANRKAYGYEMQGMGYGADAGLLTTRASNVYDSSMSTALSGGATLADRWYYYKER